MQEAMLKQSRRDIAALIEKGKLETARIKTEGIISEDIHLELLELMELYSETLLARFALLDLPVREPDPSIAPALASIIHAAPRTELKELHVLRDLLMSRYGREFSQDVMDNTDNCVPDRVMSKLVVDTPDPKLVELYIFEICKTYDVPFSSELLPETQIQAEVLEDQEETQEKAEVENDVGPTNDKPASTSGPASKTEKTEKPAAAAKSSDKEQYDTLEARFAALKRR